MGMRADDRGVSEVVGFVFVFGFLVALFVAWQATVVPAENKEVEFSAYLEATGDVTDLRNAVLAAAARGTQTGETVRAGTRYPARALFVNPPQSSGTVRTTRAEAVVLANVSAADADTRDYWNGTARAFTTREIRFEPAYSELTVPAMVVSPTGLVYRNASSVVPLAGQVAVRGNRITLVTITGGLSATGVTPTITTDPVSAPARTIAVSGSGGRPVTITLPTAIPAATWERELLRGQMEPAGNVVRVAQNGSRAVDVVLNGSVTYELNLARVSVREQEEASGARAPSPRYVVTPIDGTLETGSDGRVKLVVEARDRFNNPRSNASVTFNATVGRFEDEDGGVLGSPSRHRATVATNEEGRAVVWFNATDDVGTFTVEAVLGDAVDGSLGDEKRLAFEVAASASGTSPAAESGDASALVVLSDAFPSNQVASSTYRNVTFRLNNTAGSPMNVSGLRLDYVTVTNENGELADGPDAIAAVTLNGETRSVNAVEGKSPAFFTSDPLRIPAYEDTGSEYDLNVKLDSSYSLARPQNAVIISVTVYYEGGLAGTYAIYLFA